MCFLRFCQRRILFAQLQACPGPAFRPSGETRDGYKDFVRAETAKALRGE